MMSLAINELIGHGLIFEHSSPNKKTKTYVAEPNLMKCIRDVLRSREKLLIDRVIRDIEQLSRFSQVGADMKLDSERLTNLQQITLTAQTALDFVMSLDDWKSLESQLIGD